MARGFDHVVHAVHDLDGAASFYERLGFMVGARNRHPWGTHNRVVQLDGFYIEILAVEEPDKIVPHAARAFSFGAFHQDFLSRQQGLAMILLDGRDPVAESAAFRAAGIGDYEVFAFAREGRRPDGSPVRLAFDLTFARDAKAPEIGFATCHHHFPENFWNPAVQQHANTAAHIAAIVMVAENPADHHIFLSAFVDERELMATSSGVNVPTPNGDIQVMHPAAYTQHFGIAPPDIARGPRLAALRFTVRDFSAAITTLQAARVPATVRMGRIVVGPQAGFGAALIFEPPEG
jgi:hypothetical protein